MSDRRTQDHLFVFPTELGWMAMLHADGLLGRLSIGHASRRAAARAIGLSRHAQSAADPLVGPLIERLQAYAAGDGEDFADVRIDTAPMTAFGLRVIVACRRISYGQTRSYGQLAAAIGSPRAARAVGNCMAGNRVPIVVPCHRVVAAGGRLGGFSAPGGLRLKRRLLALEADRGFPSAPPR